MPFVYIFGRNRYVRDLGARPPPYRRILSFFACKFGLTTRTVYVHTRHTRTLQHKNYFTFFFPFNRHTTVVTATHIARCGAMHALLHNLRVAVNFWRVGWHTSESSRIFYRILHFKIQILNYKNTIFT